MSKKKNFVFELVFYVSTGTHRFLFPSKESALKFLDGIPSSFHFDCKINKIKVL